MADGIRIATRGFRDLQRELVKFGPRVDNRARKTGLRKTSQAVRRHLKSKAPEGETGNLRKSIGYKVARRSPRAWIGLRDRFYYKTLEFGRKEHTRRGAVIAEQPPMNQWFSRAWRVIENRIQSMLINEYRKATLTEARKEYQRSKARLLRRTVRRVF